MAIGEKTTEEEANSLWKKRHKKFLQVSLWRKKEKAEEEVEESGELLW